jgi:hypothetical protein
LKKSLSRSVRDEWLARLPEEKEAFFRTSVARFDSCYQMLSVALDEALSLRERGELSRARAEADICSALYQDLAARLLEALGALETHTRNYGTQPAVAPLDPDYFRGGASQRASAWNTLLHRVLFSGRSRWFHKLQVLREILADLSGEFRTLAADLSQGTSINPAQGWDSLEALHDDLNTCLREAVVMLKCFLRAIPEEQVKPLRATLEPLADAPLSAGLTSLVRSAG